MLDNYKENQPIAYRILSNAVSKDKYSHAYLIETNGFYDSFNFVMSFAKTALCPNSYLNKEKCETCHQCETIDSRNFPELEIIKPDGMWIKKSQVQVLQQAFSKKAVIGSKKIYIITEASKLKKEAANSMLKFLEEPTPGIIAILITENIYQVLETIRSRCQILSLKNTTKVFDEFQTLEKLHKIYYGENITEENLEKIEQTVNFIKQYEQKQIKTIIYMNQLWHKYITTKEDYEIAFEIMILYYKDILHKLTNRKIEYFSDYEKQIDEIINKNNLGKICQKLNTLTDYKKNIKYNANSSLLMDKLIIDLEGGIK